MSTTNDEIKKEAYFELRNVASIHKPSAIPPFLNKYVPANLDTRILDIGCGYCHMLQNFKFSGYKNVFGADISNESIAHSKTIGIPVTKIENIIEFAENSTQKYDFIILTHVVEHIEKDKIIDSLKAIRKYLMNQNAKLYIAVPNAQSNTDCYWMFEDFTHSTLFTAGSLLYVLNAAGFKHTEFIDPYGLESRPFIKRTIKRLLIRIYTFNKLFWNKVTNSSYHAPSPVIFSFELKAIVSI